jgi:penicillin-binding protein 2
MNDEIFPTFNVSTSVNRENRIIDEVPDRANINDENKNFVGSSFDKNNLKFFLISLLFLIGFLFLRVAYLQIIKGDHYLGVAEGNRIRTEKIKSKRGIIYDRNLNQLVYNRANFILTLTPYDFFLDKNNTFLKECLNEEEVCREKGVDDIKEILRKNEEEIIKNSLNDLYKKIDPFSRETIIIAEKIDYDDSLALMGKIKNIPGLAVEISNTREYVPTESMSHWIGYTGRISEKELKTNRDKGYSLNDYIGKIGLEKYYEESLKGRDGEKNIEVNALGEEKGFVSQIKPSSGNNLILTIDQELQKKSEEALQNSLIKNNKKKGVVIAMNPQNGEILSMVSLPAFNANDFSYKIDPEIYEILIKDKNKPLFNRSVLGEYPSGSIIKPVFASAALEEGTVTPWTTFFSSGGISVGDWFFPDWLAGGHGNTNLRKALARSVNTFFYITIGGYKNFDGMGIEKLKEYAEKFGLNQPTGIDLPYEENGFFPTKEWKEEVKEEQWYIGDTYHLAIGQGDLLVTPLQTAVFTSAIANGGKILKPHLVKEIRDEENSIIERIKPEIIRENFISQDNLGTVQRGMRDCVTYGSCVSLNSLPIEAAGKTGTAQHGGSDEPHAWFISFAPFDNPELAVIVLIEEGEEGSRTAAPVAKEILNWYFTR